MAVIYAWRLPFVLIGAPMLASFIWLVSAKANSFRYDDRPPRRPKLRFAITIGVAVILGLASAFLVWNPGPFMIGLAPIAAPSILLTCVYYFSGRIRPLRLMINQPNRADGTIVGIGGIVLLATGVLLWVGAIYLALRVQIRGFPPEAFPPTDQIRRLGGMTAAALWSGVLCGFGLHLRRTWRRVLAERARWAALSDRR
jgi:hypothetical protein